MFEEEDGERERGKEESEMGRSIILLERQEMYGAL